MSDIVYCNRLQSEKILKIYFSIPPVVTNVVKSDERDMYFINALTIPGLHETTWQYRNWDNNITRKRIRSCFGSITKGNRIYRIEQPDDDYPDKFMSTINKSFERAIDRYERGCDIFQSENVQYTKGFFKNIFYNLTKSPKRKYLWTIIILSILLLLSLTSCEPNNSIQNYVGSEVIDIRSVRDLEQRTYYVLKIRRNIGTRKNVNAYQIEEITCYNAQGYQPGDTIKLRKFPK